ncbi:hypothetical protein EW146_g4737 [Bondarzewia mesenterica]|uniref:Integrase zinc-binding domain-containing protein n=1 Tax=Bondarzewia mesenterica TaxID=1095465 RepID=A0A4S4LTS6_9AGAM|nr:hypothetical protein EW146_g4737 [Bondarzewia mesenterica]
MSEEVCNELALIYDPDIVLNMQSANGKIDKSLGLARNVPFLIGNIVLYLQVHVIREPAYDILLGHPFDVLTESIVKNFANENQTITIHDRNMERNATVPTLARGPPRFVESNRKCKYKPVAQKVRPILAELPNKFCIIRNISGDPLADMPYLSPNPPPFTPFSRYTSEHRDIIDNVHPGDFLWPAECDLMHHFMCVQHEGFAWNDTERGHFREDFFPPVDMPVVTHKPWVLRNMPIPPGIYDKVCDVIRTKIAAGIAEQFAGCTCGGMLDLYVGYDERTLTESSRDYTTFQTPYGALRLVTLPMGWTNSIPIFHDDVTFILQPEIPDTTIPYIDDVPVHGPATQYLLPDGSPKMHSDNPRIRRFVWEHFQSLNRVVQRMKYSGGTFSGHKVILCSPEIMVVRHRCTPNGHLPEEPRIEKIVNWGPCRDLSDVHAFLGTIGVIRIFIRNFAHRAHTLTKLTRKEEPFHFGPDQIAAQENLKAALLASPALHLIDYSSESPVILTVDTSHIALYLIGVRNLIIEVDACYIKGMLANLDLKPSASINHWILSILTFHFTLVHVPDTLHTPDALLRRPPQPGDIAEPSDDFNDWIDNIYGFLHLINSPPTSSPTTILPTYPNNIAIDADPQDTTPISTISYSDVPRSDNDHAADHHLEQVCDWHKSMERPSTLSDAEYTTFLRYCTKFFIAFDKLWCKDSHGRHKLVAFPDRHITILMSLHDEVAHKGVYATTALIALHFWWPMMRQDIAWLAASNTSSKAAVQYRIILNFACFDVNQALHSPIGYSRTSCADGALSARSSPIMALHSSKLSPTSRRNTAFDISTSPATTPAVDGDQSKWNRATYSIFWADRITIHHCMGCSPYFTATGTHPLVPLDIAEATYLLPPPSSFLSSTDLIARCAIALQKHKSDLTSLHSKVYEARIQAAIKFERDHITTIHDFDFQPGLLILMRYKTTVVLISSANSMALFTIAPSPPSESSPTSLANPSPLPDLDQLLDISAQRLQELEASPIADPEALDDDLMTSQDEDLD